jgi:hypothetical protein
MTYIYCACLQAEQLGGSLQDWQVLMQEVGLGLLPEEMHAWLVQRGLLMSAVEALGRVPAAGAAGKKAGEGGHLCGTDTLQQIRRAWEQIM